MVISHLKISLSVYTEGNKPATLLRGRGKTCVQIPVSDQLLSSHSQCLAASDWGNRVVFTLTWKCVVAPRNPFWLACLWSCYIPMKALWFLTNPFHLHFMTRQLELMRNFSQPRYPVLYQTLRRRSRKEKNRCSLNPFSLLSWSEQAIKEQLTQVWCLTGFASTPGAMWLPDVFAYERISVF